MLMKLTPDHRIIRSDAVTLAWAIFDRYLNLLEKGGWGILRQITGVHVRFGVPSIDLKRNETKITKICFDIIQH
jgi:hypothetical protein